jgi:hypothetical protein
MTPRPSTALIDADFNLDVLLFFDIFKSTGFVPDENVFGFFSHNDGRANTAHIVICSADSSARRVDPVSALLDNQLE